MHLFLPIIPAITDIGSASFKYDMRRLTEILAFPKAWYRRSIVRRMFLGDLSMSASHAEEDNSAGTTSAVAKTKSERSPLLNNKDKLRLGLEQEGGRPGRGKAFSVESNHSNSPSPDMKSWTAWETLVLFAINFKKLNVHMNMGNVMGNVM